MQDGGSPPLSVAWVFYVLFATFCVCLIPSIWVVEEIQLFFADPQLRMYHCLFCVGPQNQGFFFFFRFSHLYFSCCGQAVVTAVVPSLPLVLAFNFYRAHRVQQSHCTSSLDRGLITHALALSARPLVHKKKSLQVGTSRGSNSRYRGDRRGNYFELRYADKDIEREYLLCSEYYGSPQSGFDWSRSLFLWFPEQSLGTMPNECGVVFVQ